MTSFQSLEICASKHQMRLLLTYTNMLRVARTIADLAGAEQVGRIHVAEALSYRRQPPRA